MYIYIYNIYTYIYIYIQKYIVHFFKMWKEAIKCRASLTSRSI